MATAEEKRDFLKMTLTDKVERTKELIVEWYYQFNGNVYVSFSGGKDSTVLLHIARSLKCGKDIAGVFDDTGLEYPEVREFVKKQDNIVWIKPTMNFKQVIEKYGFPIISKEQSRNIYEIKTTKSKKLLEKRLGDGMGSLAKKWRPLLNADFKIGNKCCSVMKKNPLKSFENKSGLKPIVATMAVESRQRMTSYFKGDCNQFSAKRPISTPMAFWTEQDVLKYIYDNKIEIASIYGNVVKDGETYRTTGVYCCDGMCYEEKIKQIIEAMPSYELWKAVHEQWKVLFVENTKLKELLKACRSAMNDDEYWVQCDLIKQIDELLRERG